MTKNIQEFSAFRNDLSTGQMTYPEVYQFDSDFNKKEEIFIYELKKQMDSSFFKITPRPSRSYSNTQVSEPTSKNTSRITRAHTNSHLSELATKNTPRISSAHTNSHVIELPKKLETKIYEIQCKDNHVSKSKKTENLKESIKQVYEEENKPMISSARNIFFSLDDNNNDPSEYGEDVIHDIPTAIGTLCDDARFGSSPMQVNFVNQDSQNFGIMEEQEVSLIETNNDFGYEDDPVKMMVVAQDMTLMKFPGSSDLMDKQTLITYAKKESENDKKESSKRVKSDKRKKKISNKMKESSKMSNSYISLKRNLKEYKSVSFGHHEINYTDKMEDPFFISEEEGIENMNL